MRAILHWTIILSSFKYINLTILDFVLLQRKSGFYTDAIKTWIVMNGEQATKCDLLPDAKATKKKRIQVKKKTKNKTWSSPKGWPVTWWPLVVHWRLTQTAQSFPYRHVLPSPAGFDINTRLWLTEALALGWAPGASTVHSALLLACWFTVPGGRSLIHFPSQFAHRAPRKPSSSNIFALWFPEEQLKKNKPPLTAPVPVNVQWACRPPLVLTTGEKGCGVTSSMWIFHFPQAAQSGPSSMRNRGMDAVVHVCQFNTHRSIGAHIESCCVCIINMCVGVYVAQRPTWSWH